MPPGGAFVRWLDRRGAGWHTGCLTVPEGPTCPGPAAVRGEEVHMNELHRANGANGGRIALAALIGGMVGAGVALLYAPRSGAALRGEINRSAKELQDASSRRYEAVAERISQLLERANHTAGRAVSAVEHRRPPVRPRHRASARRADQDSGVGRGRVRAPGPVSPQRPGRGPAFVRSGRLFLVDQPGGAACAPGASQSTGSSRQSPRSSAWRRGWSAC